MGAWQYPARTEGSNNAKDDFDEGDMLRIGANIARLMVAVERMDQEIIEAHAAKVRAKDNVEGLSPAPKGISGLYRMKDEPRKEKFVASLVKEISALTDMGTT